MCGLCRSGSHGAGFKPWRGHLGATAAACCRFRVWQPAAGNRHRFVPDLLAARRRSRGHASASARAQPCYSGAVGTRALASKPPAIAAWNLIHECGCPITSPYAIAATCLVAQKFCRERSARVALMRFQPWVSRPKNSSPRGTAECPDFAGIPDETMPPGAFPLACLTNMGYLHLMPQELLHIDHPHNALRSSSAFRMRNRPLPSTAPPMTLTTCRTLRHIKNANASMPPPAQLSPRCQPNETRHRCEACEHEDALSVPVPPRKLQPTPSHSG
jgi:hypothetical protein